MINYKLNNWIKNFDTEHLQNKYDHTQTNDKLLLLTVLVEKLTKEQEIENCVWSLDYIMALNIQLMINSVQDKSF